MVVFVINEFRILSGKSEGHAPVSADFDRPSPGSIAAQGVKVGSRQAHVSGFRSCMEPSEDKSKPRCVLGLDAGRRACLKEAPETLVSEAGDRHVPSVTPWVTGCQSLAACIRNGEAGVSRNPQSSQLAYMDNHAGQLCDDKVNRFAVVYPAS